MREANTYRGARRNMAKRWKQESNAKRYNPGTDKFERPRMNFRDAWSISQRAAAMQLQMKRSQG